MYYMIGVLYELQLMVQVGPHAHALFAAKAGSAGQADYTLTASFTRKTPGGFVYDGLFPGRWQNLGELHRIVRTVH